MSFADLIAQTDRAVQEHLGGVTVTYAPEVGDAVEVTGIFDAAFMLVAPGNSSVEQAGPAVWLRLEDLPVHPDDDEPTLTIDGQDYTVRERQTDGPDGGTIRLLLHHAAVG
jgi:hypothetical protein